MGFIADEANRLGINFQEAAKAFTKFSISSQSKFDKGTQRTLFSGVSEYATILQLNKEEYQRFLKSIQQMSDKGLYAEEIYGQMAESAPGSVEALSKAFGYGQDTAAFRKRIEQGGLQLTPEKARAFAAELSKVAKSNGALAEVTKKTRAEMERFFTVLTFAKDEIFRSGGDDGLSYMFRTFADSLKELKPLATALGGIFRGVVSIITGAIKLIVTPIEILTQSIAGLWEILGADGGEWGKKIWSVIGAGGTLFILARQFKVVREVIFGVNTQLALMMRHLLRIVTPLLILEDAWAGFNGKDSYTKDITDLRQNKSGDILGNALKNYPSMGFQGATSKLVVDIVMKDDANNIFSAIVNKVSQGISAVTQSEVAQ